MLLLQVPVNLTMKKFWKLLLNKVNIKIMIFLQQILVYIMVMKILNIMEKELILKLQKKFMEVEVK